MMNLALILTLGLALAPTYEDPVPEDPVKRLEAWPAATDRSRVKKDVERLRKARTPEMGVQAGEALSTEGAAVVPYLLPTLGKEKNKDALKRIDRVLLAVTDARHTRLLAEEFAHRSPVVRLWTLERVAQFPDAGLREKAEARLEKVRAQAEKLGPKEVYMAALCTTSTGSLAGFDLLLAQEPTKWTKGQVELRTILAPVRGPEATALVASGLEGADRKQQISSMRLLGGCGAQDTLETIDARTRRVHHQQIERAVVHADVVDGRCADARAQGRHAVRVGGGERVVAQPSGKQVCSTGGFQQ